VAPLLWKMANENELEEISMYSEKSGVPKSDKKTTTITQIVSIVLVSVLVFTLAFAAGCGAKGDSIVGKWSVPEEGADDFPPGVVLNFKKDGTVKIELADNAPEEIQLAAAMFEMVKIGYKVSGDTLEMTIEAFGEKETDSSKFKVEGDTLTIFDEDGDVASVLKRAK
jgi:hypothetical protein